jgi:glucose-1-phosphate cytidylyltransferase
MKVVILAGGFGTRLSEETNLIPKPMVEIGGKPILWHIMKMYSSYGFDDFIILLGYKSYVIKEYFTNYYLHQSSIKINLKDNHAEFFDNQSEPWKITLLETGLNTMTGGRIKQAKDHVGDETFFLTYGDGLSNVNINDTLQFHKNSEKLITMTSIQPPNRYGALTIDDNNIVSDFLEKPKGEGSWINGGFFVCEPGVFDYINDDDSTVFEQEPLNNLVKDHQMAAWKHYDFWGCMDALRDKNHLSELWDSGTAPWKVWKD